MAMRPGYILIILACLLPLCSCPLSFDDLEVIEWEVVEVERMINNGKKIAFYVHSTVSLSGGEITGYHDFECTRPLNTNKLVYLNDQPLPGEGGEAGTYVQSRSDGSFTIYSEYPVKTGDVFTFDRSWFFLKIKIYAPFARPPKYKVRIVTESITFEEDE
jgi:hypothetical protein